MFIQSYISRSHSITGGSQSRTPGGNPGAGTKAEMVEKGFFLACCVALCLAHFVFNFQQKF